jgi:flagellar motor protein MotB
MDQRKGWRMPAFSHPNSTKAMSMKKCICISLLMMIISTPAFADFKSLTEIEDSLDPLEFLDNHDGVRRSVDLDIRFALASAELLPDATQQLDALGKAMQGERLQRYAFNIIGHTDASGDAEINLQLSINRAGRVSNYLQRQYGIAAERLLIIGKGETALKPNTDPHDASQRRVEIVASTIDGGNSSSVQSDETTTDKDGQVQVDW